jgi:hypothetical protein
VATIKEGIVMLCEGGLLFDALPSYHRIPGAKLSM